MLRKVTVADVFACQPLPINLFILMRGYIKMIVLSNLHSFIAYMNKKLSLSYISDVSKKYLYDAEITTACLLITA